MERVYDDYRSQQAQGTCYKYIHKCHNCGKILVDISDYDFRNYPDMRKPPNYCSECGTKQ